MSLTKLQFEILNAVTDDCEDIENIYLMVNQQFLDGKPGATRFFLRIIVDQVMQMVEQGYLKPEQTYDKNVAPLEPMSPSPIHYYWFAPTEKGKREWEAYPDEESSRDAL